MNECWYALALAMMSKVYLTPEKAFWFLSKGALVLMPNGATIKLRRAIRGVTHFGPFSIAIIAACSAEIILSVLITKQSAKLYGLNSDALSLIRICFTPEVVFVDNVPNPRCKTIKIN